MKFFYDLLIEKVAPVKPLKVMTREIPPANGNTNISGNIMVWEDGYPGIWSIYAADVSDPGRPAEFPVTDFQERKGGEARDDAVFRLTVPASQRYNERTLR